MQRDSIPFDEILRALPLGSLPKSVLQISKDAGCTDKAVRNAIDSARIHHAIFNEPRGFWRSAEAVPPKASGRWKRTYLG